MEKKYKRYSIRVTTGSGSRVSRGIYCDKNSARKAIKKLNARVDADTKNPRIISYRSYSKACKKVK